MTEYINFMFAFLIKASRLLAMLQYINPSLREYFIHILYTTKIIKTYF